MFATAHILMYNPWTDKKIARDIRLDLAEVAITGLTVADFIENHRPIPYTWDLSDVTIHHEEPMTEFDRMV